MAAMDVEGEKAPPNDGTPKRMLFPDKLMGVPTQGTSSQRIQGYSGLGKD